MTVHTPTAKLTPSNTLTSLATHSPMVRRVLSVMVRRMRGRLYVGGWVLALLDLKATEKDLKTTEKDLKTTEKDLQAVDTARRPVRTWGQGKGTTDAART